MSSRLPVVALVLGALVVACSGQKDKHGSDTISVSGSIADTPAPAPADAPKGTVHLVVDGGPLAGTYDAKMMDGGCSYGLTGAGAWGNQYSTNATSPKAFSSLQLIVPDAKAAAKGTTDFQMTVGFGPLFGKGQTSYDINTRANASTKSGSGTVTVDDKGSTGRVTFDVKSAEGVGLKGTIDCASVMRAS
jgi:hypothetical protein